MLISVLYISVLVVAVQSLLLLYRVRVWDAIDRILGVFLVIISIDVVIMYIYLEYFSERSYISHAAPFGFAYGPLLYFLYKEIEKQKLSAFTFILHISPFVLAFPVYVCFILVPAIREQYRFEFYLILYSGMCFSWVTYPILILIQRNKLFFMRFNIFKYGVVILLLLVSFVGPLVWSNFQHGVKESSVITNFIIALAMLMGCCICYWYLLDKLRFNKTVALQIDNKWSQHGYEESLLPNGVSKSEKSYPLAYRKKIKEYLALETYFDANFNLDLISKELNIPKGAISQYFSLEYSDGFVKTINSWRVGKACQLLEQADLDISMEELAYICGFNSRASFYRNFNQEKGCSPTVYREQSLH